jgi:5'-nucleotidase
LRVLVTNDDGIQAPGLRALADALREVAEVTVVAPDQERSAVSHAITMHEPLRAWPVDYDGLTAWAVKGMPADCVLLGVKELMPEPPDVVAAGINRGANLGEDVWYSGTVSAAMEAAIPGAAFSLTTHQPADFAPAAAWAAKLLPIAAARLPADTVLNVNVPPLPLESLGLPVACRLGHRNYRTTFDTRRDPRGGVYYWLGSELPEDAPDLGTDVGAIAAGCIAVTPIRLDLTSGEVLGDLETWLRANPA